MNDARACTGWFASGVVPVAMPDLWWLVEQTNDDGAHGAALLPRLALVPLLIGIHHLARARSHHA